MPYFWGLCTFDTPRRTGWPKRSCWQARRHFRQVAALSMTGGLRGPVETAASYGLYADGGFPLNAVYVSMNFSQLKAESFASRYLKSRFTLLYAFRKVALLQLVCLHAPISWPERDEGEIRDCRVLLFGVCVWASPCLCSVPFQKVPKPVAY